MGRRMKEIKQADYETIEKEEIDYVEDEFEQAGEINAVTACLRLFFSVEKTNSVVREQALGVIIKSLEDGSPYYNNRIADNYSGFLDLYHQCMFSIQNGSSKEVSLAAYIIGFLALSTAYFEPASVVLHTSLPLIYNRLKLPFVFDSVSLLNCLAIIDFLVGGVGSEIEEEEEAAVIIWSKVTIILGEAKGQALLAYGFSLTSTLKSSTIDDDKISYLLGVLDGCGESRVGVICAQVVALVFETYNLSDELREKALHAVNRRLSSEQIECHWNLLKEVAEFLEHGYSRISKWKDTRKMDGLYVQTSSWVDLIRLKFLRQFLGKEAFSEHMHKNELVQNVLKVSFTHEASAEAKGSERKDEMSKKWMQRKKLRVLNNKRKIVNKERTQNLEKCRTMKAAVTGG